MTPARDGEISPWRSRASVRTQSTVAIDVAELSTPSAITIESVPAIDLPSQVDLRGNNVQGVGRGRLTYEATCVEAMLARTSSMSRLRTLEMTSSSDELFNAPG